MVYTYDMNDAANATHCLSQSFLVVQSGDHHALEFAGPILRREQLVEPRFFCTYSASNKVAKRQKKVDNVRADVAISACDEDARTRLDGIEFFLGSRHFD